MVADLSELDANNTYKYPYKNGYITHLVFETKLHNNNIYVKYKGFVAHNIVYEYDISGNKNLNLNNIIAVSATKPKILKNDILKLEKSFISWIDQNNYRKTVKSLVNT